MKYRIFTLSALAAILMNATAFAAVDTRKVPAKRLIPGKAYAALPASDVVAIIDGRRMLTESLPQVLAADQAMLGAVRTHLEGLAGRTGLDLRNFDEIAVGMTMTQVAASNIDFDPVTVATGRFDVNAFAAGAKSAGKGFRQEKLGARTIYIFSGVQQAAPSVRAAASKSAFGRMIAAAIDGMASKDLAIAAVDSTTVVAGSLNRVKESLSASPRVAVELTRLLVTRPNTVAAFAMKAPANMSSLLPLDNDALAANINGLKLISGSLDMTQAAGSVRLMGRFETAQQAADLKDTLAGLMRIGSGLFASSKRPDQQVYGRLLNGGKFTNSGTDLTFDVSIAQADINILMAEKK